MSSPGSDVGLFHYILYLEPSFGHSFTEFVYLGPWIWLWGLASGFWTAGWELELDNEYLIE